MVSAAVFSMLLLAAIGITLVVKAMPVVGEYGLWPLLSGSSWKPFGGEFGFLPFMASTLYVSVIAIVIALPVSLLTAIYLNMFASRGIRRFFEPAIDLLSGIPPVIYGVWGTLTIVPFIADRLAPHFTDYSPGYSVLAGGVTLSVMIIPLLVSVLVELFRSVPTEVIHASLSLGATRWQTVKLVILRKSFPGIVAAVVLAISRAFGETIAVLMVCGNMPVIPGSVFEAGYPLPALIANNYGEMLSMPNYESALMFAALLLFMIVVFFNSVSRLTLYHIEKRFQI